MPGRKKENYDRGRVEFKAEPEWIERADVEAKRGGHGSLSAFIRFAVTKYMDEIDTRRPPKRRRPKSLSSDPE